MLGYDIGYYAHILSKKDFLPETMLDIQYIGDVRNFDSKLLKDVNSVIFSNNGKLLIVAGWDCKTAV